MDPMMGMMMCVCDKEKNKSVIRRKDCLIDKVPNGHVVCKQQKPFNGHVVCKYKPIEIIRQNN